MNTKLNHIKNWPELAKQSNWSVSKLAAHCDVSGRTLRRYFLKNVGTTPKIWLAEQRQKQAMELLHNGSLVKETAAELGFQYSGNFSRDFKKKTGICPTNLPSASAITLTPRQNVQ